MLDSKKTQLSITNFIIIVIGVKIAVAQNVTLPDLGALLLALLSYRHKQHIAADTAKHAVENQLADEKQFNEQLNIVNQTVSQISDSLTNLSNKQKEDAKTISEATTLLRANRLNGAMNRTQGQI